MQAAAPAQLPARIPNPGFERGLDGWSAGGNQRISAFVNSSSRYVRRMSPEGQHWLEMEWQARSAAYGPALYSVTTRIDARSYRGRRVRLSVATKAPPFAAGVALIFIRAEGSDNRAEVRIGASEEWVRHAVAFAVPREARILELGFVSDGTRTSLAADDVRLEVLR